MPNRPPSAFSVGQRVRVVAHARMTRLVTVRSVLWHFQAERYDYYLDEDGRKVSKCYVDQDLESVE